MATAIIGLGGNLGDAQATVRHAIDALARLPDTRLVAASRLYRTPAWGGVAQADFINAAARLDTDLAPRALLQVLQAIEHRFGRVRLPGLRWGPRTLDLDILLYGRRVIDEAGLQVPHPRLHERAFALIPLLEVMPEAWIPGQGPAAALPAGLHETGAIRPIR